MSNRRQENESKTYYIKMIREDQSTGRFKVIDTTIYPPKEQTFDEYAAFIHAIRNNFNIKYENNPNDWIEPRKYQKDACLKFINSTEFYSNKSMHFNHTDYPKIIPSGYKFSLTIE
jgi:hypothetical protein